MILTVHNVKSLSDFLCSIEKYLAMSKLAPEELEDFLYTYNQAVQAIHSWKAHQLRSVRQDTARIVCLSALDETTLIFINDMLNVISKETSLPLFADDSECFRLILGWDDGDKLQDDLNQIFQWSCIWGMEFNAKKCEVLKLARTRSIIDKDYYLGGTKLDRIDVKKDLWVLSWNNHVYLISSKAQIMLNLLLISPLY